ncbi:SEC-C metal-binding domain-containing protein [Desulfotruncus alcoholivorax]|uniref:SEC-C metal-binding domain-containing protein n=1 Tax=Desulfotruncus alcoholivorax TaxID=265477 RepID=UPI0004020DBE|nr:SEC-C metal-binding domain-containing protein [Desulfotruncus alcoholivorax]
MNNRMDEQIMEALLKVMDKAKDYRANEMRKKEEKLWKEISVPCRLAQIINQLAKNEMDSIRKSLGLKNLSGLKKQDLAGELIKLIPEQSRNVFVLFDKERYRLAKRICDNNGFIFESSLTLEKIEYFREHGIIFSGSKDDKKILTMPLEVLEVFRKIDKPELKKIVDRNTEWIRLSHGLLYYYGVLNFTKLEDMIEKFTGARPDTIQYMEILYDAARYYGQIKPNDAGFGFCDARVFDAEMVMQEQNARPGVDYYPFTKGQLIKAGEAGFIDRTPALNRFINFLLHHYEMTREEADEIAEQCTYLILTDEKPGDIIEYLGSRLEFPSFEVLQQLTGEIMNLFNNTRRWILKGHTPEELFRGEKKHLQPLPAVSFVAGETGAKVIDIRTRTKVGRNDPCPCGSGKKYKNCCGK